jgi:twitching motility protein PilT
MAQTKPIPLAGRLAIQLGMLTREEVDRAIAQSNASGNPRLGQIFLEMGLLDRGQLAKLQAVQKDLVEKHRAKQSGGLPPSAEPRAPRPAAAQPSPPEDVHAAAQHAAENAAPMTSRDVDALAAPPQARPAPAPPPAAAPPRATAPPAAPSATQPAAPNPAKRPAAAPLASAASATPATPGPSVDSPEIQPTAHRGAPTAGSSLGLPIPEPGAADRERLEAILAAGTSQGASDIHLHAGGALKHRVHGALQVVDDSIDPGSIERIVCAALTPEQRQLLAHEGQLDFCFDLPGVGRFRANAYRQQRGLDAVFRTIPDKPPTLAELGLPEDLKKYTDYHQGMVLITGPAGCGKSSTLAALVDHINGNRDEHILTVEDPIETIHPSKRCLVNQRHAGQHTASFSRALRAALREDPDIIVIGELRDLETIRLAMTAAETGHFVLATLHTANAVRTVNRMIGAFPSNEQDQVRAMLSESLRAVLSQRLVPTADGQGRAPALELLVINRAIGNLIRDEKTVQIRSSMQTGKNHGMYLLEQSLNDLVAAGTITREVALELAEEKKLITAGA